MREDVAGLFWDDTPPPKLTKPAAPPREPPPRTWEEPGYLPYLAEARRFPVSIFTNEELGAACAAREYLVYDVEIYKNYFLAAFTSLVSGKVIYFEFDSLTHEEFVRDGSASRLRWVLENFTIVTFNGNYFDLPITALALAGFSTMQLKAAANRIIGEKEKPWMVLKSLKVKKLYNVDHIDLIEVCPLQGSLKIYGGRVHAPRMQELPFHHEAYLSDDQIACVRWYCVGSDLVNTAFIFEELRKQIDLRISMSSMYGVDLRSKSDAQIAEAVIVHEWTRLNNGLKPGRPEIAPGTVFKFKPPSYIKFETADLQYVLATVAGADYVINEAGYPINPEAVSNLLIPIGTAKYQVGIGGLHSTETNVAHFADENTLLIDRDVTSYYPSIILNQGLYPQHLGTTFLDVYRTIVTRRIAAKKAKNKTEADTLKIVINGSYGKLGSKWSVLYAPDLMLQVTLTGQLTLLMLIERFELAGFQVCSANTDGVLVKCPKSRQADMNAIVAKWETDTGFMTEDTHYHAILARDVNSYIAVKTDGSTKVKGDYAEFGSAGDSVLSKNPVNLICRDAVKKFLTAGEPLEKTIRECRDIRRFVSIRTVKGGAVKDGEYLGKAIRWYQSSEVKGEIIYAETGDKVAGSDNCRPCMELPIDLPQDIDYLRYEAEAYDILREIGYPMSA